MITGCTGADEGVPQGRALSVLSFYSSSKTNSSLVPPPACSFVHKESELIRDS